MRLGSKRSAGLTRITWGIIRPWLLCILIKAEDDSESYWAISFTTAVPSCVIGDILILTEKDHRCTFPTLCSSKRLLTQSQCRMYNYCSAVCRPTHVVKQCGHRKYSVPMEYLSRQRPIPGLAVAPNVASHPDQAKLHRLGWILRTSV